MLSAVACIGASPDEISNELAKWWNTSGRGLLQTGHVMGEDEEAEDASDVSDAEEVVGQVADGGNEEAAHAVRMLEREAVLAQELQDPPESYEVVVDTDDAAPQKCLAAQSLEPTAEPPRARLATLHDMLKTCEFLDWKPPAEDTPVHAVQRLRLLCPHMVTVIHEVVLGENFLSQAMITGGDKPMSAGNAKRHELARAQQNFMMVGARASRAEAWRTLGSLVTATASTDPCAPVAGAIANFRPSFLCNDKSRSRCYQFLAIREHECGPILLALTDECYRWSRKKRAGTTKQAGPGSSKPCPEAVPADWCSAVQVRLLEGPRIHKDQPTYLTTTLHRRLHLMPHNLESHSAQVLYEIPPSQYTVKETDAALVVMLTAQAQEALESIQGLSPSSSHAKEGSQTKANFTYDMFTPTASGKQAIVAYLEVMRKMYGHTTGKELVDNQGLVHATVCTSCPAPCLLYSRKLLFRVPPCLCVSSLHESPGLGVSYARVGCWNVWAS